MKIHVFRLKPGSDLKKGIEQYVAEKDIQAAAIITCVGSLTCAGLRMAGEPDTQLIEKKFEITSLAGTLSVHGCHLHLSLSDSRGNATGGHVKDGCIIYTTAEIVICEMDDMIFTRETDDETGYRELTVKLKTK